MEQGQSIIQRNVEKGPPGKLQSLVVYGTNSTCCYGKGTARISAWHSTILERQSALRTLRELYTLWIHYEPLAQDLFLMSDTYNPEVRSTWQVKTWTAISESALSQLQKSEEIIDIGYAVITALLARHLLGWQWRVT